ncbi:PEP-CTERM sorting domain-containing protein [Pontiellaceae bacterium B12219]|nr:PEP-CTERM sorting domain-containing protein [Pontiellaceae bacterium B12219]
MKSISEIGSNRKTAGALLLCTMVLPCISLAATVTPTGNGSWDQNWNNATVAGGSGNLLPSASVPDTAIINNNRIINVDSVVDIVAGSVILNNQNGSTTTATLNINSGGSLTTGVITVSANDNEGTLNVQGGALTVTDQVDIRANGTFNMISGSFSNSATGPRSITKDGGGGTLNIQGGTFTALGAAASDVLRLENDTINISGGTVSLTGGQVLLADTTTLTIAGDAATIKLDNLNMNTAGRAATINFNFDETGVSTISNDGFLNLDFAKLRIDGSAYTGGAATFDLFDAVNVASLSSDVIVTGFGVEGVDYTFTQSTTENIVQLKVIPEPATLGLIGAFGGGMLFIRRRFLI